MNRFKSMSKVSYKESAMNFDVIIGRCKFPFYDTTALIPIKISEGVMGQLMTSTWLEIEKTLNEGFKKNYPKGKVVNFSLLDEQKTQRLDIYENVTQQFEEIITTCREWNTKNQVLWVGIGKVSELQTMRIVKTLIEHLNVSKLVYPALEVIEKAIANENESKYALQWQEKVHENVNHGGWPVQVARWGIDNDFRKLTDEVKEHFESQIQLSETENRMPVFVSLTTSQGLQGSYGKFVRLYDDICEEILLMTQKACYEDSQFEALSKEAKDDVIVQVDFLYESKSLGNFNYRALELLWRNKDIEDEGLLIYTEDKRGIVLPGAIDASTKLEYLKVALVKSNIDLDETFTLVIFKTKQYK